MVSCLSCNDFKDESEIVKLNCSHSFCWICINKYLKINLGPKIKCPLPDCQTFIRDALIRRVLADEMIEKYENLCVGNIEKSHHCLLPGCTGSIIYTDEDVQYACPSCTLYNCIKCEAAHNFTTCSNFQSLDKKGKRLICKEELRRASGILNSIKRNENRITLMELDSEDLLKNQDVFTCSLCTMIICKGGGIQLRNCSHEFCKTCLNEHITRSIKIPVICPNGYCQFTISDREIQCILNVDDLILYQTKLNEKSKKKLKSYFQCQTPNCNSFYEFESKPTKIHCEICKFENCTECNAIHEGSTCKAYQESKAKDFTSQDIERKIKDGKLMRCPGCRTILEKISGCNWVQCQKCSLECCWILQIARWGPKGHGDISGGCKCGVNETRCDVKCTSSCTPHNSGISTRLLLDYDLQMIRGIRPNSLS